MKSILYFRQPSVGYILQVLGLALMLHACRGIGSSESTSTHTPSPTKKVIFILNGLWQQDTTTFDGAISRLSTACSAEGLEVQIHKMFESQTSERPIVEQAKDAFSKIQQSCSGPDYEIILIGHSQGGLRAAQIVALNQAAKNPLNIKGLVTLGTPWEGAHATTITPEHVQHLLGKFSTHALLKVAGAIAEVDLISVIDDAQKQLLNPAHFPTDQPGVQDMNPKNKTRSFLKGIEKSLEQHNIPILAIAGWYKDKITTLLPHPLFSGAQGDAMGHYVGMMEKIPPPLIGVAYTRLFVGSSKHDMVVSVHSQLAKGFTNERIEQHIIKGAIHDALPGFSVSTDQVIYNHPKAIERIVQFVKQHCSCQ